MWGFGRSSHYSPAEQAEILDSWCNELIKTDPELAEDIVISIAESVEPHCTNSETCGNHMVFRHTPVDKPTDI